MVAAGMQGSQQVSGRQADAWGLWQVYLSKVAQAQMRVLQKYPLALHGSTGHVLTSNNFLSLTHADSQCLDLLLLCQILHIQTLHFKQAV